MSAIPFKTQKKMQDKAVALYKATPYAPVKMEAYLLGRLHEHAEVLKRDAELDALYSVIKDYIEDHNSSQVTVSPQKKIMYQRALALQSERLKDA